MGCLKEKRLALILSGSFSERGQAYNRVPVVRRLVRKFSDGTLRAWDG